MQVINRENETISHHYTHHVLLMAAIPVICAFIGTTDWLEFWRWHYPEVILVYRTGAGCPVLWRYARWGRGDGAGHLVDGA